jgi:hypothetical protein
MGAETSPFSYTAGTINTINPGTGNKTVATFNIMDYSATDKHKTSLIRVSAASRTVAAGMQRWATTDAITSVTLAFLVGNYVAGSTFSLYGVYA